MHEELRVSGGSRTELPEGSADWLPPVDIIETAAGFEVSVELCGVARQDVNVHLEDGGLSIWGLRRTADADETCHYRERPVGRFARAFSFRTPIDEDRITAKLANGVLTLGIPKKLPKRIPLG